MDAELAVLSDKIGQIARLCGQLKAENRSLRQQVLALQQQNQQLVAKVDGAKTRVAAVLARLPGAAEAEE
ncbi:hypothetical protein N8I74_01685 [Chitiniphilus purpureus]|uniref:DUF904 domain-containing protein n=1 Tax=Chitiniphilus purpureus TaxID=2981137 RepID=A0ABY6DNH2_9NEIS|nr:hypothetical protein [Chitiniphilus sp. CD1]UXY15753.1 hypothetical protein N8I74_01685 [Chitiniphilus sp. CD1]